MNRDELIAQLRDIHLPAEAVEAAPLDFAFWPIVAYLATTMLVLAIIYWRRSAWRREVHAELRRIEGNPDRQGRWLTLIALAVRVSRLRGLRAPLPTVKNSLLGNTPSVGRIPPISLTPGSVDISLRRPRKRCSVATSSPRADTSTQR